MGGYPNLRLGEGVFPQNQIMSFSVFSPLSLGMTELVIIFVAVLLIFGSGLVPVLGRVLGQALNEFRLVPNLIAGGASSIQVEPSNSQNDEDSPGEGSHHHP